MDEICHFVSLMSLSISEKMTDLGTFDDFFGINIGHRKAAFEQKSLSRNTYAKRNRAWALKYFSAS
jgi:hypothetical protein